MAITPERVEEAKRFCDRQKLLGSVLFDIHIEDGGEIRLIKYNQLKGSKNGEFVIVVIPDFITHIEDGAFKDVTDNLKIVYRGNSIKNVSGMFSSGCG